MAFGCKQPRKLWSEVCMTAAYQGVVEEKSLRKMNKLYNVPIETLRRRVNGSLGCKPGPFIILSDDEEDIL